MLNFMFCFGFFSPSLTLGFDLVVCLSCLKLCFRLHIQVTQLMMPHLEFDLWLMPLPILVNC